MHKHYVKIYGKRRTGTNFLYFLINDNCRNTRCLDNQFGGKHHRPRSEPSNFFQKLQTKKHKKLNYWKEVYAYLKENQCLNSAIIIKNPYSWYTSIERYTGKKKTGFDFKRVFERYNMLYGTYRDFYYNPQAFGEHYGRVAVVTYEDLLRDPKKELLRLGELFGFAVKKKISTRDKVSMSPKFPPEKRQFYLRKDTFGLRPRIVRQINKIVDWDLMSFYGYTRIEV